GYVYDQNLVDGGSAITNSLLLNGVITAYVRSGDAWSVWPANYYGQFNPQSTDSSTADGVLTPGYYSFLTPPGVYRLEASAPGYQPFQSEILTVITTPIHLDIGLTPIVASVSYVEAPANLWASVKSVDKFSAWVGEELTYDITLYNSGDESSDPLVFTETLPAHTAFVNGSLSWDSGNATYDAGSGQIVWQVTVPGKTTAHLGYRLLVTDSPGMPFDIVNATQAGGSPADLVNLPGLSVTTNIQNQVGLALGGSAAQAGNPGQVLVYSHLVTNTGNAEDTFTFDATSSQGWAVTTPDPLTLAAGLSALVDVNVFIPTGAAADAVDTTTFTVTSGLSGGVSASADDVTTVNQVAALTLGAAAAQDGGPGKIVTYTHLLTNQGNGADTFTLQAVSSHGWTVTVSPNPTLGAGASATVTVQVHIPAGAAYDTVDNVTLTATSTFDGAVTAQRVDTTTVTPVYTDIYLPTVYQHAQ
ncbi:MAG: hypothetical protein L0Z70_00960, partial [Chloroflexi bacterium]|nr:hypothetical protein [Chloroflexota bacterium]